ncbi:hypothetical protein BHU61_01135 [Macrococcus epidermidis]|uniref:DUF3817 domain-containing protein n=1 Tax=Macrococcus epidermidis TaxID=1902580 RepID=A0A327ZUK9_9STAP|nr:MULTISPECIES: DUF3817 domain-containing protein [Macrococcus]MCG7419495.1 DUF3817 domain-containing protein [Macrococcus epidermidis]MCH4985278.1 DUF3817 domain-containing protein [Macrococcus sp. PK]RAK46080.1 hypothetical protein BHU61_01135 [Macrococcus epidermidis]TDM41701.1 DUF3817 domain-containing protein [Macrococcus goetzii]TDM48376.1 DUF3817 domain-containing protein [Macrococcus goetzii]
MNNQTLKSVFRFFGFLEGGSLLLLMGIAMPLKYMAGKPEVVTVVGSIHGFLFTIYIVTLVLMTIKVKWDWKWPLAGFIVAFIPFGTFIYDHYFVRSKYY